MTSSQIPSPDHGSLAESLAALRSRKPLVLCITNRVTTQRVADTLLAAGASPVMADHPAEIGEMLGIADALYLNAGLHASQQAAFEAVRAALQATPRPSVLDPVGAGATPFRSAAIRELLSLPLSAVRGNASEIRALAGAGEGTRGVDSAHGSDQAAEAARQLVRERGFVVAVSGERDLIVGPGGAQGFQESWIEGGHPWLTQITGSGCALGALVAAFCAVLPPFGAACAAHQVFSRASEGAAQCAGPGSFSVQFLDRLSSARA